MKSILLKFAAIVGLIASSATAHAQFSFVQFMKEIRSGDGAVLYNYNVPSAGAQLSQSKLTDQGLTFELWADNIHPWDPQPLYLIRTSTVGTYTPQGSLNVVTLDQSNPVHKRTRADHAYTLNVNVSGMLSTAAYDTAATKHDMLQLVRSFRQAAPDPIIPSRPATGTYPGSPLEFNGVGVPYYPRQNLLNGAYTFNNISSLIAVPNPPPFGYGTEDWTIITFSTAPSQTGTLLASEQVASDTAYILPMATAAFVNITNGATYGVADIDRVFTVNIKNIYPWSDTYLQIYAGPPRPGVKGTILGFFRVQDPTGTFTYGTSFTKRIGDIVPDNGQYTLEVVTDLGGNGGGGVAFPGAPEVITQGDITFNFDMGMKVRTGVDTAK